MSTSPGSEVSVTTISLRVTFPVFVTVKLYSSISHAPVYPSPLSITLVRVLISSTCGFGTTKYVVGSSVGSLSSFGCSSSGFEVSDPSGLLTELASGSVQVSEISSTTVPFGSVPLTVAVFSTPP